jgi:hypothetical protein
MGECNSEQTGEEAWSVLRRVVRLAPRGGDAAATCQGRHGARAALWPLPTPARASQPTVASRAASLRALVCRTGTGRELSWMVIVRRPWQLDLANGRQVVGRRCRSSQLSSDAPTQAEEAQKQAVQRYRCPWQRASRFGRQFPSDDCVAGQPDGRCTRIISRRVLHGRCTGMWMDMQRVSADTKGYSCRR